jgi:hypothetical protein
MHLHIDLFIPNDFSDIFIRRSKYPVKFKDSETLKLDREGERERERERIFIFNVKIASRKEISRIKTRML